MESVLMEEEIIQWEGFVMELHLPPVIRCDLVLN